uniref:Uncharacterized protein n=1 Tax=Rhizophora mucronata TaxID=61149 RepID=A0A2P2PGJ2_RHIMU
MISLYLQDDHSQIQHKPLKISNINEIIKRNIIIA